MEEENIAERSQYMLPQAQYFVFLVSIIYQQSSNNIVTKMEL